MQQMDKGVMGSFVLHDGFLSKGNQFCIPKCSIRELLVREAHGGGLTGHFGIVKTLNMLQEHLLA